MDKDFIYPIFWKGGLYTSRTRLGKEDYLLLKDDNGNLFNVPASEVSETDEIFDAECAADAKVLAEYERLERLGLLPRII